MTTPSSHPYDQLTPDVILDAVETTGRRCDGHFLALNSYENRVFQVGIEDERPLVVKFYRPDRWPDIAIHEEHSFTADLASHEIPVVAPLTDDKGETLFVHAGFRFALFTRKGGHTPPVDDPDALAMLGRFLGRIHAIGEIKRFSHRPSLDVQTFGWQAKAHVLTSGLLPTEYIASYQSLCDELLQAVEQVFEAVQPRQIRLHGDCHPGNILWTDHGPHFVDMDDCRMGPAVQDLWMLLDSDPITRQSQLAPLLEGYQQFRDFDYSELALIEPLRALRLVHYTAWLAQRWNDPAFPAAFPWFGNRRYWEEYLNDLVAQLGQLQGTSDN